MTPLQLALTEGRLTHGSWTRTDADGRQLLCILAAMSPEVAQAENANACPANVAPLWLANLLPWMDDAPSNAYRPEVWRRVADLQARWVALWPAGWPEAASRRADLRCRRVAVVEARAHVDAAEAGVLVVIDGVLALLDRAIAGDEPSDEEWVAAMAVARAAAMAAVQAAARTAAWAVARTAAWAAAWVVAWVVAWAAWAEAEARAKAEAAADRMIAAMLDAVEAEVAAGEAA